MIKIEGLLTPYEWDEFGTPHRFSLQAFNEQEYHLSTNSRQNKELEKLLMEKLVVEGYPDSPHHPKIISVHNFYLMEK